MAFELCRFAVLRGVQIMSDQKFLDSAIYLSSKDSTFLDLFSKADDRRIGFDICKNYIKTPQFTDNTDRLPKELLDFSDEIQYLSDDDFNTKMSENIAY